MRTTALLLLLLSPLALTAQPSTEVYLFDLHTSGEQIHLFNPINVSDNAGYDNQPSFSKDGNFLYYASTRNGQTDILQYEIATGNKTWLSDTEGGEYSPQVTPDGTYISAVRLDPDGLQRLYKYPITGGEPEVLIEDLVVGYYAWFFNNRIISFVLGDPPTLQSTRVDDQQSKVLAENPGRSIHYIPASKDFSYIDKNDSTVWYIKRAVPGSDEYTRVITETLEGSEDMAWMNMHTILMGQGSVLYAFNIRNEEGWQPIADLSDHGLTGISRLAVHGGKLAIVVEGN